MPSTLSSTLPVAPRKQLRMRGETDPQKLRNQVIGTAIDRALRATGWTNDAAAREMDYGDNQTSLRRWIEGVENPNLLKLWKLGPDFRRALWLELAPECGVGVVVETVVRFNDQRRSA